MKLMAKGRVQHGWSREETCTGAGNGGGGCGAVLLVEQDDLYLTESHCRDETDALITFMCTACGVETDVKGVPSGVVEVLPPRSRGTVRLAQRALWRKPTTEEAP